jgi:multiple sugar transport system substrate-binding protein
LEISMSEQDNTKPSEAKNNLSRRDFLKLGTAATVGAVAVGATGNVANAAARINVPYFSRQTKKEIKLLTWFWTEPGRNTAWRTMIQKFHDSQSDIHINEAGYGENDYFSTILIQAKSGQIDGDLFCETPDGFLRMRNAGFTVPLEDVVKNAGVTLMPRQDFLRVDGQVHGLSIVTVAFGLLYNSNMYNKAGLKEPTSIDEWVAASKALTVPPNQYGTFSPHVASDPFTTWFTLEMWPVLFGGVWAKGQTPLVNSDAVINGLKLFLEMWPYMPQGTDAATSGKMFGANQIASQLVVSAAVNEWKTNSTDPTLYPGLRSAQPFWPGKKAISRTHPICVNAKASADNQAAAKTFLSWLYKKENYQQLLELCLDVVPDIVDGATPEYLASLPFAGGYNAEVALPFPDAMGDFIYYDTELGEIVVPHFQEALAGNTSVEDAMNEAQKEAEDLAARVFANATPGPVATAAATASS